MCFSSRCYCGTRAESRRNHGGVTADMAIPLSYHCGLMAVPRRSLAAGLRCWRQHCGASEVPLRGWRCYCGATAVALRQQGGSMTSARRLYMGGGFRSYSLPFSLLLRTLLLLLLLLLILLLLLSLSYAAETCYNRTDCRIGESQQEEKYSSSSCSSSSSSHQGNHCLLIFCLLLLHMQQLLYDDQISVIICHSVVLILLVENFLKLKQKTQAFILQNMPAVAPCKHLSATSVETPLPYKHLNNTAGTAVGTQWHRSKIAKFSKIPPWLRSGTPIPAVLPW